MARTHRCPIGLVTGDFAIFLILIDEVDFAMKTKERFIDTVFHVIAFHAFLDPVVAIELSFVAEGAIEVGSLTRTNGRTDAVT